MKPPIYAVDFETAYSKTYSIRDLGNYAYCHHPEFHAYLISVAGDNGFEYVGSPEEFDWSRLNGADIVMHNAGFDTAVVSRLMELDIIKCDLEFNNIFDTADLAAYLSFPRSLAEAAKGLLGIVADKSIRDNAKGKIWGEQTPEYQDAMKVYALADARLTLQLWLEYNHKWPEWERELSSMTRVMCSEGLSIDLKAVKEAVVILERQLAKCRSKIPWAIDATTPALSKKLLGVECAKHNVTPPVSMAKDAPEFDEWLRQHGDNLPFAKAMGAYRRINMTLKKFQTVVTRTIPNEADPDRGQMPYALKYGGAHTMRDSGDAGLNVQNLNRKPVLFGPDGLITNEEEQKSTFALIKTEKSLPIGIETVDLRAMIAAPPGKIFGVVDLSAIEPCCLNWLAEDEEFLELLRQGLDPYHAQAQITGRYNDPRPLAEVDPSLRQYMKVEVLGLGYGAGPEKTIVIGKTLAGLDLTIEQTTKIVADFRKRRFIPNLWKRLEDGMRKSAPGDHEIELPSGRVMLYRQIRNFGSISMVIPRNGRLMRLKTWGGSLAENVTQSFARDVFMHGCITLKNVGINIIGRFHDEVLCLFNEHTAEADLTTTIQIMSTVPDWAPGLPLRAAGFLCQKYTKG